MIVFLSAASSLQTLPSTILKFAAYLFGGTKNPLGGLLETVGKFSDIILHPVESLYSFLAKLVGMDSLSVEKVMKGRWENSQYLILTLAILSILPARQLANILGFLLPLLAQTAFASIPAT